VIVKSVNRIFFRSSVNQGLILIVQPEMVRSYQPGDRVSVSLEKGIVELNEKTFHFPALPEKLLDIVLHKGLVNWIRES
jgi:3-isopropylmalate dehydratase small subunit